MSPMCRTASTEARDLLDESPTAIRVPDPPLEVPDGTVHAYIEPAATTLCGLPLADMRTWPDLPFPVLAHPRKCGPCQQLSSGAPPSTYSPAA